MTAAELADKATLREYHREFPVLGAGWWGVSERTLRAWMSDNNRRTVPLDVIAAIESERADYAACLAGPPPVRP